MNGRAGPGVPCDPLPLGDTAACIGLDNLASFVAVTMGRIGQVQAVPGGVVVSSTVLVANGYVNAAFRADASVEPTAFVSGARAFFTSLGHPFVAWAPLGDPAFVDKLVTAGGSVIDDDTPMMSIATRLPTASGLHVRPASTTEDRLAFGLLCQSGYGQPGLAWLLDHHQCDDARGTVWAIAADDAGDLGVGCGFLDGSTGGIYYVATPEEHRGRGAAAAVTSWLVNYLMDGGATHVVLQASDAGLPVYQRLGFRTVETYRRVTFDPVT